jgi:AraC-like DNA-binding protein
MIIGALIVCLEARVRIRQAVRGWAHVCFCERGEELLALAAACSLEGVVTEPWDADGRPVAPAVRLLRERFLSTPVAVYCALSAETARELLALARAGADEIILRGVDDVGVVVRSVFAHAGMLRVAAQALQVLAPGLPPEVVPVVSHCLVHAREAPSVEQLAGAFGIHRKTLVNRLATAGLPSPSVLISWGRLLLAARLLEDPGRSVEQVGLALNFGSGGALRSMLRRYTGLRPYEIRENGGMDCVLHLFRKALGRPVAPRELEAMTE